jgi:hypothetical protein
MFSSGYDDDVLHNSVGLEHSFATMLIPKDRHVSLSSVFQAMG